MRTSRRNSLAFLLLALWLLAGCDNSSGTREPKPPSPDKQWTAEEVAGDPAGYMRWADAKVAKQIDDRRVRINQLDARLKDVEVRQQTMTENVKDMANIQKRMETALRKAEDEDRWPVVMAGRKFDKAEAVAIIEESKRYIEDRKSLATAYEQAVEKLKNAVGTLGKEIEDLTRLREKMALDLEAVKLSESMDGLEKLRKAETEIASYAKALKEVTDDSTGALPDDKGKDGTRVDVEAFLSKSRK